ncbi:uncharacterized protein LOC133300666 [Gastrolobium bilobum]|uniref:uncharacterized protein LOC133300666 n=1 Tax=Gastrolobium bilobum TaxID=150636 RepID=UPI002AB1E3E0|nr:uncharacterized protein LOC133300666 [Gastrolobium bilobum]
MLNYAKFMKDLLSKKRKLKECETMALTEECSAIIQKKLPPKMKDPGSFSILIEIGNIEVGKALCDLGASINLMPLSMCRALGIKELKPTTVFLQLADKSIRRPDGVIEDVLVKIDKFIFPADFVVLNMEEDTEIPLLLGRPFLATARAMIDVEQGKLMLRVNEETVTIDVFESMKHPTDGEDYFMIDIIQEAIDDAMKEEIFSLELEQINEELEINDKELVVEELKRKKDDIPLGAPKVELKELSPNLKYAFLGNNDTYLVIINVELTTVEEDKLLKVLKKHKAAIGWSFSDLKGINPSFCTHKILMEDDMKPVRQPQRRLNPTMKKVVRKEVVKLLDAENLSNVLQRCQESNLVLNWEKCHFMVKDGIVLGHKVSQAGIEVDRAKISVIEKLPPPSNVKGIRSFLGHAGFYRRFIKDFSKIAKPLCKLLVKDEEFNFSDEYLNYATTEKELLAVVYAFDKFRPYLLGSKVVVYTDHAALKYFLNNQDAKPRLLRWMLLLQEFEVEIRDKKRVENLVADHLSKIQEKDLQDGPELKIKEEFPDEKIMAINVISDPQPKEVKTTSTPPWFADFANFKAAGEIPVDLTWQQRKKFLHDVKKYLWDKPFLFYRCADGVIRRCIP